MTEAESGVMAAASQGKPTLVRKPQKLGRGKEEFSVQVSKEASTW